MRTILSKQTGNGRFWWSTALVAALAVGVVLGSSLAPGSAAGAQAATLTFSGEVGVIVNLVNSANTGDFLGSVLGAAAIAGRHGHHHDRASLFGEQTQRANTLEFEVVRMRVDRQNSEGH